MFGVVISIYMLGVLLYNVIEVPAVKRKVSQVINWLGFSHGVVNKNEPINSGVLKRNKPMNSGVSNKNEPMDSGVVNRDSSMNSGVVNRDGPINSRVAIRNDPIISDMLQIEMIQ